MRTHFSALFILFSILSQNYVARAAEVEVFVNGEKPGIAKPLAEKMPIDLEMARGEYETVIVRAAKADRKKPIEVKIAWKKSKLDATKVELHTFWLGSHQFAASSFRASPPSGEVVDIVIPNSWIATGKISVPAENIPKQATWLLEFYVAKDAKPGKYDADLEIKQGKFIHRQAVQLWIHQTQLPAEFELAASFGFSPWDALLKAYGKWNSNEMELYRDYQDLALEHHIDLHKIYVKFPEDNSKDPLSESAVVSQSYASQTEPLFEGLATPHGHRMHMTDLPVKEEMKGLTKDFDAKKAENFWKNLDASVVKRGLKDKTFVYFIDEPQPDELKKIGEAVRKIRKWAPNLTFLGTHHYKPELEGAFNLWCVNLFLWNKSGEPSPDFYAKRQKEKHEKLWFYVGCNSHGCDGPEDISNPDLVIDRASVYHRSFPWVALRYNAEGILYYDTVYGYNHGSPQSPWKDAFSFSGYGEGNLFYPCNSKLGGCKQPKVLVSLRLKIVRDGLEDVQIMKIAKAKNLPIDEWVKKIIPNEKAFPSDNTPFEELKRKVLRELDVKETKPDPKGKNVTP
jgi:hypothetical protein